MRAVEVQSSYVEAITFRVNEFKAYYPFPRVALTIIIYDPTLYEVIPFQFNVKPFQVTVDVIALGVGPYIIVTS